MTLRRRSPARSTISRVGFFGLLGQGNLGNDGSLEATLAYVRSAHPGSVLDARCTGPDVVTTQYGLPATPLHWHEPDRHRPAGAFGMGRRALGLASGLIIDTVRTASWVRRHDSVIVPGMGVLEQTVPLRAWQTPYLMFLLSVSGRLFSTKVALVSVGANVVDDKLTRWLVTQAARLASYRSFRDTVSRDAMRDMGLDVSSDPVYPDVVFSLRTDQYGSSPTHRVGVGVMDYSGGNRDRQHGDQIRADYVAKMTHFVLWLLANGRRVRVFTSDSADDPIVAQILAAARAEYPYLSPGQVVADPVTSLTELLQQTASVDVVVATRFHNVAYSLRLGRPTVAIGYAAKHEALMAEMGMSQYCQQARSLDVARLIEQFTELEGRAEELRVVLAERNSANARLISKQFMDVSAVLFPEVIGARHEPVHAAALEAEARRR